MKRTGVSYFGVRIPRHVRRDLEDIAARGYTAVLHTFSENDLAYYRGTMADIVEASHELALEVYRITDQWPMCERYQLTAQIRRAALSAPTNIAEGASKRGPREFRRYLDIARGSLSELSYLLRFSKDRGILNDETFLSINELRDRAGKVTWGLYASLAPTKSS